MCYSGDIVQQSHTVRYCRHVEHVEHVDYVEHVEHVELIIVLLDTYNPISRGLG